MINVFDRVTAMRDKPQGSSAIAYLIDDVKGERDRQETSAARLDSIALDPRTSRGEVEKARKDREEALFQVKRLEASVTELGTLHAQAVEAEKADQDRAFYEEVKAERDALAKDLEQYPELAGKLADIVSQLNTNAARVRDANAVRPESAEWLANAEDLVCGAPNAPQSGSRLAARARGEAPGLQAQWRCDLAGASRARCLYAAEGRLISYGRGAGFPSCARSGRLRFCMALSGLFTSGLRADHLRDRSRGIGLPGAGQETGLCQLARYLLQGPLALADRIAVELLR